LGFAQLSVAHDPIQGLAGAIPRHQHTNPFVGQARLAGFAATSACAAIKVATALVRFKKVGFIRLCDALQLWRTVFFEAIQKAVPPA
jgi:hypothetical protein